MAMILDNKAISPSTSPTQETSPTPYALRDGAVTSMPDSELNTVRRGGPGSAGVTLDLDGFVVLDPQRLRPAPVALASEPSPIAAVKPHSSDLDNHVGTIEAFNRLIKENNPTAAYGFLNNLLASGMERGVYKPGHLEAVADIVNQALKQPGVSPAMAQEVLGHLKAQVYVNSDDATLVRIMDLAGAGVGSGNAQALQGDTLNQSPEAAREIMDRRVRGVLIDLTMTAEQKLAELNSIKEQYKLSGQGLRDSIDRALPNDQNKFVETLSLEQIRKLQTDMNKVDDKFGSAFGLWENNGLQRALNRAEEAGVKQAEKEEKERLSQKLNEDRLAKEAAARLEAQRIDTLKQSISSALLNNNLTSTEKIDLIRAQQRSGNFDDRRMAELIGQALAGKEKEIVAGLSLEDTQKLRADMKKLDAAFGGLKGNDALQKALKNHAQSLIDEV